MSSVCRICLSDNLRLRFVENELISVYDRLTTCEFNARDPRSKALCGFCYQKLLKCYTFCKTAQRSEWAFGQLFADGVAEVALRSTTELNLGSSQQFSYSPMMHIEFNDNDIHDSSHVKEEQISVEVEPISVKMEPISVKEEITEGKECLVDEPVVDASLSEEDIKNVLVFEDGTEEVELTNARYYEKKNLRGVKGHPDGTKFSFNSESTKASTTEVQTITSRKRKKTNAQRCREYRERKKLQKTMVQNITAERSDECSKTDQLPAKKPKTDAERRKKYYEAQKLKKLKIKKIPKTAKQRNKEYYERKKKFQAIYLSKVYFLE